MPVKRNILIPIIILPYKYANLGRIFLKEEIETLLEEDSLYYTINLKDNIKVLP